MKSSYRYRILFITKSLLWSVAIYTSVVMAMDWEEIMHNIRKQPEMVFVNNAPVPVTGHVSTNHLNTIIGTVLLRLVVN